MPFTVGRVTFRSPLTTEPIPDAMGENKVIKAFRKTIESQRQAIVMYERKVADLSKQNDELRHSRVITPEEDQTFKMQAKHTQDLQKQLDQLALWLRKNKSVEIAQGRHIGKSLVDCILMYLGGTLPAPLPPTTEGKAN